MRETNVCTFFQPVICQSSFVFACLCTLNSGVIRSPVVLIARTGSAWRPADVFVLSRSEQRLCQRADIVVLVGFLQRVGVVVLIAPLGLRRR